MQFVAYPSVEVTLSIALFPLVTQLGLNQPALGLVFAVTTLECGYAVWLCWPCRHQLNFRWSAAPLGLFGGLVQLGLFGHL